MLLVAAALRRAETGARVMDSLPWPDHHHLLAAQGWLELGNPGEALADLEKVSPLARQHPAVLYLYWDIYAHKRDWEPSLRFAEELTRCQPNHPGGWISLCFALHELKRTAEARDKLLHVVPRFPDNPTMRYNLACYEAQLGNLDVARRWLDAAFALPGSEELKNAAPDDPDLAPLGLKPQN